MATLRVSAHAEARRADDNTLIAQSSDPARTFTTTAADPHMSSGIQAIGTSAEALDISGDIATAGYGEFTNMDDAVTVEVGVLEGTVFVPFAQLGPGESMKGWLKSTAIYAQAGTGGAQLKYLILER